MAASARGKARVREILSLIVFLTETLLRILSKCAHVVYNSHLYSTAKTKNEVQVFILKWSHVSVKKAYKLCNGFFNNIW